MTVIIQGASPGLKPKVEDEVLGLRHACPRPHPTVDAEILNKVGVVTAGRGD
jgi:hypothetical protein